MYYTSNEVLVNEERVLLQRMNLVIYIIFFHILWMMIVRRLLVGNFFCCQDQFPYKESAYFSSSGKYHLK